MTQKNVSKQTEKRRLGYQVMNMVRIVMYTYYIMLSAMTPEKKKACSERLYIQKKRYYIYIHKKIPFL